MIKIASGTDLQTGILFFTKEAAKELYQGGEGIFKGEYLQTFPLINSNGKQECLVGIGNQELSARMVMEAAALGSGFMRKNKISEFYVDLSGLKEVLTEEKFSCFIQGLYMGGYEEPVFGKTGRKKEREVQITLLGCEGTDFANAEKIQEAAHMADAVLFARDMVNLPGNYLRPSDFAEAIRQKMEGLEVETEILKKETLEEMGMGGLLTVGGGSAFPPCMVILRYRGKDKEGAGLGLIGKGVTCDTGGYCLKPARSMSGIRGDMAGGAAVAGCIYALAKNKVKANVVGVIPICENRISPDSYLPGDVITMYDKSRVEICNTDAEGRLILADAAAYAVKCEGVDKVVDIATLTGAVVSLFGFTIGGVLCDNDAFYRQFQCAAKVSTEQYSRIPYYEEHEEMLKSTMADMKHTGADYCGTITAGLFIHRFVEDKPWLHMDIAGTAWVDTPVWKFQSKGATGAGVTTLYELCRLNAAEEE